MVASLPAAGTGAAVDVSVFASPTALAHLLFSTYLLPFEVTSVLLLVAMVGVVVLTRDELRKRRTGDGRTVNERPFRAPETREREESRG
jgi:hypothetical protein